MEYASEHPGGLKNGYQLKMLCCCSNNLFSCKQLQVHDFWKIILGEVHHESFNDNWIQVCQILLSSVLRFMPSMKISSIGISDFRDQFYICIMLQSCLIYSDSWEKEKGKTSCQVLSSASTLAVKAVKESNIGLDNLRGLFQPN